MPIESVTVVSEDGNAVDVATTMDNNYFFHVDGTLDKQLDFDMAVTTTTGDAFIWLKIVEDSRNSQSRWG